MYVFAFFNRNGKCIHVFFAILVKVYTHFRSCIFDAIFSFTIRNMQLQHLPVMEIVQLNNLEQCYHLTLTIALPQGMPRPLKSLLQRISLFGNSISMKYIKFKLN